MKKAALILLIFIVPIAAIIFIVIFSTVSKVNPPAAANLQIWGYYEGKAMQEVIANYRSSHPYATITYTKVEREGLRQKAVEAWALGNGPDILMIPSNEVRIYQPFLVAAPATTTSFTYTRTKQFGIKEEIKIVKQTPAGPNPTSLRQDFVDAVSTDAIIAGQVYGMPITMDTLLLYSNRTLLNQARVAFPAKTWAEFVQHVPTMTLFDNKENLVQSGAALGAETNVAHAEDVLSLLILQNGGAVASGQNVLLDQSPTNAQAVEFFTDFANPTKVVYSWTDKQSESLSAFAEGKVGYYIGFAEDEATIKERGAGIQYDITEIPQVNIQRPVTIAQYDMLVVAKTTKNPAITWNILQYLTSKEGATSVLNQTRLTPARKDLVQALLATTDPVVKAKVSQSLIGASWYAGANTDRARTIMQDLIKAVRTNAKSTTDAIREAAQQMRLIIK